jgi:hypothetical protein
MAPWQPPRMREIHHKLREDFRRELRENYGFKNIETDPILEVLFRSVASQIEDVYDQAAEAIPLAVLDELMMRLGIRERRARPAQTVLRFSVKEGRELIEEGVEVIAEAKSKEKFTFAMDTTVEASAARISLVAVYQNGTLGLHQGTELPEAFESARPSFELFPADLGLSPAIFLAVDVADERHLSRHGFYFEVAPNARDLLGHLQREIWCLVDEAGEVREEGMMRSRGMNAGVRGLAWFTDSIHGGPVDFGFIQEGFYGGRVFVFPEIPPGRQFLTTIPKKMKDSLIRMFQVGGEELFDRPRAWIRISLPKESGPVAEDLLRIVPHCVSASNVEILNQTLRFDATGTSIPVGNGSARVRHLVKVISVKGETGTEYVKESEPVAGGQTGRYRYRQGRLEIFPARKGDGAIDSYANVRLLLSNGSLDGENSVGAGAVTTFLNRTLPKNLEFKNLNAASGGTNEESFEDARVRFAEILLSRERVLTRRDLDGVVRAFEPKVLKVETLPALERAPDGLHRVQMVKVSLNRESLAFPEIEADVLQRNLQAHLQERALLGLEIRVVVEWI